MNVQINGMGVIDRLSQGASGKTRLVGLKASRRLRHDSGWADFPFEHLDNDNDYRCRAVELSSPS